MFWSWNIIQWQWCISRINGNGVSVGSMAMVYQSDQWQWCISRINGKCYFCLHSAFQFIGKKLNRHNQWCTIFLIIYSVFCIENSTNIVRWVRKNGRNFICEMIIEIELTCMRDMTTLGINCPIKRRQSSSNVHFDVNVGSTTIIPSGIDSIEVNDTISISYLLAYYFSNEYKRKTFRMKKILPRKKVVLSGFAFICPRLWPTKCE